MSTSIDNPMTDAIRSVPSHFQLGLDAAGDTGTTLQGLVAGQVILCGMGGSAFPGDILATVLGGRGPEIAISRDYSIIAPRVSDRPLVIASSFSGNTEETLASYQDARRLGYSVVVVTAGGKLADMARADGVPCCILTKPFPTFQPRAAAGMFVSAFLRIMNNAGLVEDGSLVEQELLDTGITVAGTEKKAEELAERMAAELGDRTPVIYANGPYAEAIAKIAKIKFNENSKCPAFFGEIPELNHNEMVGFTRLSQGFQVMVIRDDEALPRNQKRVDTTIRTLREHGVSVVTLDLEGSTAAERIFRAIQVFDFISVYCAARAGIDPNPVHMVEGFKAELGPFQL